MMPATHDRAFDQMSQEEKDTDYADQLQGYPSLSRFMASSRDFCLLHRFSPLQMRCLLLLQNEIAKIDTKIKQWDELAMKQPPGHGQNGSFAEEPYPERTMLLHQAIPLLQQYNELVASFAALREKRTATQRQAQNIQNWLATYPLAIDPREHHFQENPGDMFPLTVTPKSPLIDLLERWRLLRFRFTLRKRPERSDRVDNPFVRYTSDHGQETAISILALAVGLIMLFASVWWLNFVGGNNKRLGIITGSVFLFTAWAWAAAGNRPFEILAAVAGYTAVLMIYRQLSPT